MGIVVTKFLSKGLIISFVFWGVMMLTDLVSASITRTQFRILYEKVMSNEFRNVFNSNNLTINEKDSFILIGFLKSFFSGQPNGLRYLLVGSNRCWGYYLE